MKNQEIKAGDYVYTPIESTKVWLVQSVKGKLMVETNLGNTYFSPQGLVDLNDLQPSVFLATPENKIKIEQFYDIELEEPPIDKVRQFERELDTLIDLSVKNEDLEFYSLCKLERQLAFQDMKNQKQRLIEMFRSVVND